MLLLVIWLGGTNGQPDFSLQGLGFEDDELFGNSRFLNRINERQNDNDDAQSESPSEPTDGENLEDPLTSSESPANSQIDNRPPSNQPENPPARQPKNPLPNQSKNPPPPAKSPKSPRPAVRPPKSPKPAPANPRVDPQPAPSQGNGKLSHTDIKSMIKEFDSEFKKSNVSDSTTLSFDCSIYKNGLLT